MNEQAYKEDLAFLRSQLGKHPLFAFDQEKRLQFECLYNDTLDWTGDDISLIHAMTLLTSFFHDGHTNIELPYTSQDKCLNIPCDWHGNRLLLSGKHNDVPSNWEIVAIENTPMDELVNRMSERIPHENIYLVKSRMVRYPYANYHLFSERNLRHMFNRECYEISFSDHGKIVKRQCALQNYDGYLRFRDTEDFLSYEIGTEAVTLHLNVCICNETYKETLKYLAELCEKEGIKTFVLDLSKNMGGSSAVIDEFIKYVDIDEFKRYEMIDYATGRPKYITKRQDIVKNSKYPTCFPSNLYCKVSCHTFSSARTFAVTLKDNGIATIIGTPTGGKPNSFGMPKRFETPHSKIAFRVSSCIFLRPNGNCDDDISLFPDIEQP